MTFRHFEYSFHDLRWFRKGGIMQARHWGHAVFFLKNLDLSIKCYGDLLGFTEIEISGLNVITQPGNNRRSSS